MLGRLGPGGQRGDEVDGRVFALPELSRVRVVLLQHGLDVLAEDLGDLRLEVARKTFDQITSSSSASVDV